MRYHGNRGFTLLQLTVGLAVLSVVLSGSIAGARSLVRESALEAAAIVVRAQLAHARAISVARRESIELTLEPGGHLRLADSRDSVLRRTRLFGDGGSQLDSASLRPVVLRFNSRGQAAPGSIYLYGRRGGIRLVVNFLGRVREERLP